MESPPRENLFRAAYVPGATVYEERAADGGPERVLHGHFAVFNRWTEIDSIWEGQFLERIAPGAFKKTFSAPYSDGIRALFQHGRDPQIGDKPLGPIESLTEDETGAAYEVPLFDTAYNRELIPGLAAGVYGASFRFKVWREELNLEPEVSDYNPKGIPERTIREAQVMEFGPVTFPAYPDASAGLRSLTDEMLLSRFIEREPMRVMEMVNRMSPGPERILSPQQTRQLEQVLDNPTNPPVEDVGLEPASDTRRESSRPLVIVRNPNRHRGTRNDA